MLRGKKTKKEKELSVEKTSITRPGPAQLTHWIHFPNNHFLFFLFFFLDLNFGGPFFTSFKAQKLLLLHDTLPVSLTWAKNERTWSSRNSKRKKKNDRKEKKMKFFFNNFQRSYNWNLRFLVPGPRIFLFFKSTGCPGAVLSGTQSSRPSLTLQFAGHNHHQNGKGENKREKKKKISFWLAPNTKTRKPSTISFFFFLSSCVCVLSLWKHLFNNKSAPQHVIVWCVDGDKKEEKKRVWEREREFPRLDLSRTLQKSSAPAICDGRKKK